MIVDGIADFAKAKKFATSILESKNIDEVAMGIDANEGDDLRPQLKCNYPCFECEADSPDECVSCWGKDRLIGKSLQNKNYFR